MMEEGGKNFKTKPSGEKNRLTGSYNTVDVKAHKIISKKNKQKEKKTNVVFFFKKKEDDIF
jgi:hypothetical protein